MNIRRMVKLETVLEACCVLKFWTDSDDMYHLSLWDIHVSDAAQACGNNNGSQNRQESNNVH